MENFHKNWKTAKGFRPLSALDTSVNNDGALARQSANASARFSRCNFHCSFSEKLNVPQDMRYNFSRCIANDIIYVHCKMDICIRNSSIKKNYFKSFVWKKENSFPFSTNFPFTTHSTEIDTKNVWNNSKPEIFQ